MVKTNGSTLQLKRVFRAPPERMYKAFINPDAMCKFLPPYGFTAQMHHMDVKVGGTYRMSFTNFGTGKSESFNGKYLKLKANEEIQYTDQFEDPKMLGMMQTTITFRKVLCGTELSIVQEGIPSQIPVEFCYLGWQETLAQLAHLVEPEIPDAS